MIDTSSFRRLRLVAVCFVLLALALAWGCSSSVDSKLKLAALTQDCLVNSDCSEPLVCAFKACHVQCESSRDCGEGARCLATDQPYKVCQLESERNCTGNLDCEPGLVCGVDGECRDACQFDLACVKGQVCVAGTCADTSELDTDGRLTPAPGSTAGSEGTRCVYVSDCSASLLCRDQSCLPQCKKDVDCPAGQTCQGTRCQVSDAAPKACSYNSQCDSKRGERCSSGACHCACVEDRDCPTGQLCDGCACQADPKAPKACNYNSDCATAGQICRENACSCQCQANADCGVDERCDGCGCVDAQAPVKGIVYGDVSIGSALQLDAFRGVTEIQGNVSVYNTQLTSLKGAFDSLRRVNGNITFLGNAFTVFDGFPVLEQVNQITFQNERSIRSIALPTFKQGNLALLELSALTSLSVSNWEHGSLTIRSSPLTELDLPRLLEAQTVSISQVPLMHASFLVLAKTQSFSLDSSGATTGLVLDAPLLATVQNLNLYYTTLTEVDSLLKSLAYVDSMSVTNNSRLSQCAVDALVAAVRKTSKDLSVSTGSNGACPL